jgi:heme exporter protein A
MLEADQLSCDKGDRPLFANLSFSLRAGQCLHVQGDNGAGKTSLLRILAGLAPPAAGVVRWCGQVRDEVLQEFRAQTLYFGHLPAIKSELSAWENLSVGLCLAGRTISEMEMLAALDWAGLKNRAHQAAGSFSAGQKRRINLALMKLRGGQLWVLDEPTTSLDVRGCELLQGLLTHHLQIGGALVLTSHVPVNLPATQVLSL